jgi:NADH/F420H2 dehydrogenase subunit C
MTNFLYNSLPVVYFERNTLNDHQTVVVTSDELLGVVNNLKLHINSLYTLLSNVTGVDLIEMQYRFAVVYELLSIKNNQRMTIKVFVNEVTPVPSLVSVFKNSNWWEREVWDMFGIFFENHPDLRRILTDYGFQGFPLRKDFPLSGFVEVQYDDSTKKVEIYPLTLTQEMRKYNYENPWLQSDTDVLLSLTSKDPQEDDLHDVEDFDDLEDVDDVYDRKDPRDLDELDDLLEDFEDEYSDEDEETIYEEYYDEEGDTDEEDEDVRNIDEWINKEDVVIDIDDLTPEELEELLRRNEECFRKRQCL